MASVPRGTRQGPRDQAGASLDGATTSIAARNRGSSINDLPDDPLRRILHTCGRHTRRVCHHWCDAYGPLTCGLHLTHLTSHRDLLPLPAHLASVRTLVVTAPQFLEGLTEPHPHPTSRHRPNPQSIIAALPRTFPRLTTLHLDFTTLIHTHSTHLSLAPLAPLHPHLTALHLRSLPGLRPLATLPATLPLLRTLTFTTATTDISDNPTFGHRLLTPLSALSHLLHLSAHCTNPFTGQTPHSASLPLGHLPGYLPQFACLPPTLTHLHFRLCRLALTHTPEDLQPFSSALPNLQSLDLALALDLQAGQDWSPLDTLTAALSQRQALTHLAASLVSEVCSTSHTVHGAGVQQVSQLHNLRALELTNVNLTLPIHLMQQVAAAGVLTRLVLPSYIETHTETCAAVAALVPGLAATLADLCWIPGNLSYTLMACLGQMTALRSLKLVTYIGWDADWQAGGQAATAAILSLTGLTQLHLPYADPEFVKAMLLGLPALASLRQLHLHAADSEATMSLLASVGSNLTHLQLGCLRCRSTTFLRALRRLPRSVRRLRLYDWQRCFPYHGLGLKELEAVPAAEFNATWAEAERLLLQDLLPLPCGLRVFGLSRIGWGRQLSGGACGAIAAAARGQDCVVDGRVVGDDDDDGVSYCGCNGYC